MFRKIGLLRALLVEKDDNVDADLTLIHNESLWGHQFSRANIPLYESISKFQKHVVSLSSLSLRGFHKMKLSHSSHLMPPYQRDFQLKWLYGLLKSLSDFRCEGDKLYWDKMREFGFTDSCVIQADGTPRRNGRRLLQSLYEVGGENSELQVPCNPQGIESRHLETFLSLGLVEITYRKVAIIDDLGEYAGYDIPNNAGWKQKDDFGLAEHFEDALLTSAFPSKTKDDQANQEEWGSPLIPKLLAFYGYDRTNLARMKLSKVLVYVCMDLLQVSVALQSNEQIQEMLGEAYTVNDEIRESLIFKFGNCLECVIPGIAYSVFCSTVKFRKLLSREEVVHVLRKARRSRRILFKKAREIILGTIDQPPVVNISVTRNTTIQEIREAVNTSILEGTEGNLTYEMNESENDEASVVDVSVIDTFLQEEARCGEKKKDERRIAEVMEFLLKAVETESSREIGNDELLDFAGASVFLEETSYGRGGVIDSVLESAKDEDQVLFDEVGFLEDDLDDLEEVSLTSGYERKKERRKVSLEAGSVPEDFREDSKTENERLRIVETFTPVPNRLSNTSGGNSSGSDMLSSTKIPRAGVKVRKTFPEEISVITHERTPTQRQRGREKTITPIQNTCLANFCKYLDLQHKEEKISQQDINKLLKYISLIPHRVSEDLWNIVTQDIGDLLLTGSFMGKTDVPKRLDAHTICVVANNTEKMYRCFQIRSTSAVISLMEALLFFSWFSYRLSYRKRGD